MVLKVETHAAMAVLMENAHRNLNLNDDDNSDTVALRAWGREEVSSTRVYANFGLENYDNRKATLLVDLVDFYNK